eukprot:2207115-Prorocentrum_lima.AAC.1
MQGPGQCDSAKCEPLLTRLSVLTRSSLSHSLLFTQHPQRSHSSGGYFLLAPGHSEDTVQSAGAEQRAE